MGNVHALVTVGVNAEGYREILGLDVTSSKDGAGWLAFFRSLVARGLSPVRLVTPPTHTPPLVAAIGSPCPGPRGNAAERVLRRISCPRHRKTRGLGVPPACGRGCERSCTSSTTIRTLILFMPNMIG